MLALRRVRCAHDIPLYVGLGWGTFPRGREREEGADDHDVLAARRWPGQGGWATIFQPRHPFSDAHGVFVEDDVDGVALGAKR